MKHTHPKTKLAMRMLTSTLIALLLTTSVSCSKRESQSWNPFSKKETACESAFRSVEMKLDNFTGQITGRKAQADKTAMWQATSAFLVVLAAFALIAGAALGSKARRSFAAVVQSHKTQQPTSTEPTDESSL